VVVLRRRGLECGFHPQPVFLSIIIIIIIIRIIRIII